MHCAISLSRESPEASSQTGGTPASAGPESMHDILPEIWAELFQRQQHLLDLVLPRLCQRLQRIFWGRRWLVQAAESNVLNDLFCLWSGRGDLGPEAAVQPQGRHSTTGSWPYQYHYGPVQ
ncbi:hypothetical protein Nmel_008577 [Mimus melanotis]